jgi:hypothetical protein
MAETCAHQWATGRYFLLTTDPDEPRYQAPPGYVPVRHCEKCGEIRMVWYALRATQEPQEVERHE